MGVPGKITQVPGKITHPLNGTRLGVEKTYNTNLRIPKRPQGKFQASMYISNQIEPKPS